MGQIAPAMLNSKSRVYQTAKSALTDSTDATATV